MRTYSYSYQDAQGLRHEGEIQAASKDEAYAKLRAQGIRPMRVTERIVPVVRRGLRGLRKRDILTIVLAALLLSGVAAFVTVSKYGWAVGQDGLALPRQVIVMPSADELVVAFPNESHRMLAQYAIPGRRVLRTGDFDMAKVCEPVSLSDADASDVLVLKRIVIGLQQEAKRFAGSPDASARFAAFLDERQSMEAMRFSDTLKRVANREITLDEANKILRNMGLQGGN